jgi:ubiquinone/menaquinone biosynthesis C-methylase UbiE
MKLLLRSFARKYLFSQNTLRYRVEFARLEEAFKLIGKQGKVVDGGAGSGEMLRKLKAAGYCVEGHGLEPDPKLFPHIEQNFRHKEGLSCTFGGLLDAPFPDASFDCAMSTQVLEHIEDDSRAAAELARIVKPGGYLVVSVPHPPEPFPNPGHVREGYTEEDLKVLFPGPSFQLLHTSYFLTRTTLGRMIAFGNLPLSGSFMPVALADKETGLSADERRADTPFGIMAVFRKR